MKGIAATLRWIMQGKSGVAATIQTFVFQILILAINIFTGMLTARTLGSSGRGELAAIYLWPHFIGQIFAFGLGPALLFNLKKYPEDESQLFSAALVMGAFFGALAAIFGWIFIPLYQTNYSAQVNTLAQLFVLTAPASLLTLILLNAYRARNLFRVVNQTNYLIPFSTLIFLGTFAVFNVMTPLKGALAYRIPYLAIFAWKFVDLWRHYRPSFEQLKQNIRRLIGYSWRSAGINILSQVADRIDQVLVIGFLDPEQMGLYVVALGVSRMLNVFQSAIVTVLFPKTAARPRKEVCQLAGRAARVNVVVSSLTAVPLLIFGSTILPILYGPDFSEAVNIFRLLGVEVIVKGTTLILAQAFMAVGKPGIVTILQGLGLGLSFPLMFWLIPEYGLLGTGLALLCSTSIRLIFILSCFPLVLKTPPPSLLPNITDFMFLKNAVLGSRNKAA